MTLAARLLCVLVCIRYATCVRIVCKQHAPPLIYNTDQAETKTIYFFVADRQIGVIKIACTQWPGRSDPHRLIAIVGDRSSLTRARPFEMSDFRSHLWCARASGSATDGCACCTHQADWAVAYVVPASRPVGLINHHWMSGATAPAGNPFTSLTQQ